MVKSLLLFFDTENQARLLKKEIKEGKVEIEGQEYIVDTSYPLWLKTKFGFRPVYLLKWNDIEPAKNVNPPRLPVKGVKPQFKSLKETAKYGITPELLRKLSGMKILGNMIKTRKPMEISGFMMLIMGLIIGACLLYSFIYFKIIPI